MEKLKYIFMIFCSAIFLGACEDDIKDPSFDITLDPDAIVSIEDGVYVCQKDYVKFKFSGNPDMITFFTGENGSEYKNKDRFTTDGTPYLHFTSEGLNGTSYTSGGATYAEEYDSLKVFVSSTFKGISRDVSQDASNILDKDVWTDITNKLNMPKRRSGGTVFSGKYDLSEYKDSPFYLAFRFACRPSKTSNNTDLRVSNLRIYNQSDNITDTIATTISMGWTPYNFIITDTPYVYDLNVDAPVPDGYHRTWVLGDLQSKDRLRIRGSAGKTDSHDWIISEAINLKAATPDKPKVIKGFDDGYMATYNYTYTSSGEYTVTFIASNSHENDLKSVVKEIKIKVID